jgi:DUF4097 and DUF4098 domain-containing protein YvlB
MKFIILFILCSSVTYGQLEFDQTYDAKDIKHVVIDNFKGNIKVRSTTKDQISIKVTNSNSQNSKSLKLKEYLKDDVVAIYIDNPCKTEISSFDSSRPFEFIRNQNNCTWDGFEEMRFPDLQFEIEIPVDMNIYVSTIMDGIVDIKDIKGTVFASNVNGPIVLNNVSKVTNGTTVNGDVDVSFSQTPTANAHFSTINGEINLNVPVNTSVTANFKSFNGDLYTDLDAIKIDSGLKNKDKLEPGEFAKIGEYSQARIGSGDIAFYIETFNGNAYLKKNK